MKICRSAAEIRTVLAPLRREGSVGLVPTMGALHEGHLSLVRLAGERTDAVVVSIFVNPLQFSPSEDLAKYPRQLERDLELLSGEGVEAVFCPDAAEFYRPDHATYVVVENVTEGGEGAERPGHFRGVATVVAKLFLVVQPDLAVFGRKDLQQAAVIGRMVRDLDFPVEIVVAPISREEDGLARSSRNVYLSADDRRRAAALPRILFAARHGDGNGARAPREIERETAAALVKDGFQVDYVALVDPETMRPVSEARPGAALSAAVRIGNIRLLDNVLLGEES